MSDLADRLRDRGYNVEQNRAVMRLGHTIITKEALPEDQARIVLDVMVAYEKDAKEAADALGAKDKQIEGLEANQWPLGKRPNPVTCHTFGDFAVCGDEASIKRVQAAMHEHDAMMPERIKRIQEQAATITSLREEVERLQHVVEFVTRWAWRDSPLTDAERLSAIKYHPAIKPKDEALGDQT